MNFLYTRKQPEKKGAINWPELVFYAEAAGEGFQELTITTLKSHYNSTCQEAAVASVAYMGDDDLWQERIQLRAEWEMDNGNYLVQEHVRVDKDLNAYVVIDADIITDTEVDIALTWLEQTNIPGERNFGDPKSFTSQQIKEIQYNATAFK